MIFHSKKQLIFNIFYCRYIELNDEIRSKIEGPIKVAKKLERMEKKLADSGCSSFGQDNGNENNNVISSSDNDSDVQSDDDDDNSSDSGHMTSPNNNNNNNFNGNAMVFSPSESLNSTQSCCQCSCQCHHQSHSSFHISSSSIDKVNSNQSYDAFTQTLSTGDIVITKVYFEEKGNQETA